MSIESLVNRPCVVVNRASSNEANAYGDKIPDETPVETFCEIQQRGRSEGDDEISDTRWIGIFRAGTTIRSGDAVIVDGETYEVEGDPWRARNPRSMAESHIEATLRRTSGPESETGS